MELEKLTASQIVLLCLLISFVTSIATGIVTVTLLEQSPEPIVQQINRVVERTVERVVPGDQNLIEETPAPVIPPETPPEPAHSLALASSYAVSIFTAPDLNMPPPPPGIEEDEVDVAEEETVREFLGHGIVINGEVVTDASILRDDNIYTLIYADGYETATNVHHRGSVIAMLGRGDREESVPLPVATRENLALGDSLFAIQNSTLVPGTITELSGEEVTRGEYRVAPVTTTFSIATFNPGTPIVLEDGTVLGIKISEWEDVLILSDITSVDAL